MSLPLFNSLPFSHMFALRISLPYRIRSMWIGVLNGEFNGILRRWRGTIDSNSNSSSNMHYTTHKNCTQYNNNIARVGHKLIVRSLARSPAHSFCIYKYYCVLQRFFPIARRCCDRDAMFIIKIRKKQTSKARCGTYSHHDHNIVNKTILCTHPSFALLHCVWVRA